MPDLMVKALRHHYVKERQRPRCWRIPLIRVKLEKVLQFVVRAAEDDVEGHEVTVAVITIPRRRIDGQQAEGVVEE